MKKKARHILCTCILLLLSNFAHGQEFPFIHYTPDNQVNPLPSADIRTTYQDRLGYLWVAIYSSGLLRYNGHNYTQFSVTDGLRDLTVREIIEDSLGRLWIGSDAGLVVSEKPLSAYGVSERIHFTQRLGSTDFVKSTIFLNRLCLDSHGSLWIGTREDGIIRYRFAGEDSLISDTIQTNIRSENKNRDIRSITMRRDHSVWASVGGGEIFIFSDTSDHFTLLTEKNGILPVNTEALFENSSAKLFGGCRNGVFWELDETDKRQPRVKVLSNELKNPIYSIIELPDNSLMAGSDGSGIMMARLWADTLLDQHIYTQSNGLISDNVSDLLRDHEGNIWISQIGGISKLRSNFRAFANYTSNTRFGGQYVLPNTGINIVLPSMNFYNHRLLCLGTSGGGLVFINEAKSFEVIEANQGLRNNWVNGIVADDGGNLWIGTAQGINCLALEGKTPPFSEDIRTLSLFGHTCNLASYRHTTIYACKKFSITNGNGNDKPVESIWFPGYQVIYCFAEGHWFELKGIAGLPATFFHDVAFDDQGRLLIGTRDRGIYRSIVPMTLAKLKELQKENDSHGNVPPLFENVWDHSHGAPTNEIQSMLCLNNMLWVGTPEGLAVLETDRLKLLKLITTNDGLRANNTGSLAFSKNSNSLWVGTNYGLAEIDPQKRTVLKTVTKEDGLVNNEVWFFGSVAAKDDGTVYFGTAKGLSTFLPARDNINSIPPILRFEGVKVTQGISSNEVDFEYNALSYADEKRVRFKTRLVGYDTDWSPEKMEVTIRYTNLPAFLFPKEYTFELLACNNYSVWSPTPMRYSFNVEPPWWFRWWWITSNLVILVTGVILFNRHRIKRLEERSRELERIVEERTLEVREQATQLEEQNVELAEKNQEILRTQQQLITQEKLASLGALTAGIAHEIKNPLNFVNNFSDLSVDLTQELWDELTKNKERLDANDFSYLEGILTDLKGNAAKINEHGKRADGIVRGMLLHSQGQSGERVPTNINALVDEYVTLAFHGVRGQDQDFNVAIKTDYDTSIGQLNVIQQDLSRVILNIVNNGCYAVNERKKKAEPDFAPTITVSTKNLADCVEIRIRDNGVGIPQTILKKVFEPFFTTKPTGKGTGLGLSLSYDIIVKGHGGQLIVNSEEGAFTEFIIQLPKH
jgi:signal transduction histidine kinase/ligand-binding sensor domain-containing protein